jgi:PDZ domain-containing secreted protein
VRWFRRLWVLVPVAAIAAVTSTVYLPYYALGPGPARPVEQLIRFDERPRYESEGRFVLTSVRFDQLTALGIDLAPLEENGAQRQRRALAGGTSIEDVYAAEVERTQRSYAAQEVST